MEKNQPQKKSLKELNEELKTNMLINLGDKEGKYIDRNQLGLRTLKR